MDYPQQLAWKENRVRRLIGRFGPVRPIVGMESPYHYRNKVQAAFGLDGRQRIISGVYQSASHRIVPVDSCMIEDKTADKIIVTIRGMMPSFHMLAYDERTGTGFLRHVLVKRGFATGQVMVVLVAASPIFKLQKPFVKKLLELHPEITTIVLNVNDKFTPLVLGQREKILYGKGYIEDVLCGKTFRISPRSFYQINPVQTEVLYSTAIGMAGLTGRETVLDAYCGTGTIALIASGQAKQVLGVELNRDTVRDAIANARQNGVTNCWFTAADAGEYMEDMAAHHDRPDVVFMDPPRAGSDEKFLRSLLRRSPPRVIYISCNPETLARDLEILQSGGYKLEAAQPVDMFPWTSHCETACALSRIK
ncbi:MAG: 23S rRNA (uracil(1939)-C(5))-methyltransferase RlmD [Oscillospiraceae bacterium]|nr:23S rRNA (uracil(1939)-C(5))-methyltransferase RlmD [Oscillospiraceae bacterium]